MPTEAELMQQSQFVFLGTVQKLRAVTLSVITVKDDMAVVTVDEVYKAPEALGDWTGKEITVQLTRRGGLEKGQQVVFYTNGWLYGESLAVREVGRWKTTATTSSRVPKKSARLAQKAADEELQKHIAEADLVVVGQVSDTKAAMPAGSGIRSEHDPDWMEATIEVESVEKGAQPPGALTVLFPQSMDVQWAHVPKFQAGQEGIWILKTGQVKEVDAERTAVLSPLDFHEKDQLDQVRALISP